MSSAEAVQHSRAGNHVHQTSPSALPYRLIASSVPARALLGAGAARCLHVDRNLAEPVPSVRPGGHRFARGGAEEGSRGALYSLSKRFSSQAAWRNLAPKNDSW